MPTQANAASGKLIAAAPAAAGLTLSATTLAQQNWEAIPAQATQLNAAQERLLGCETRSQALEAQLRARDDEIAALTARLVASSEAETRLNARLLALRARLTAPEGGTVTAADARKQAATDAEMLAPLIHQGQGINNPRLWQQIREAENNLHRSQSILARADSARTIYRARPGDTLPQVALMFYGDTEQWSRVYDANRHVINDPNSLLPGLTLVIP